MKSVHTEVSIVKEHYKSGQHACARISVRTDKLPLNHTEINNQTALEQKLVSPHQQIYSCLACPIPLFPK